MSFYGGQGYNSPKGGRAYGRARYTVEALQVTDVKVTAPPVLTVGDLSPDQRAVYDAILGWLGDSNARQDFRLGGLAGTGKSALTSLIASELLNQNFIPAFCAYTGKAANVLGIKLKAQGLGVQCSTIHSLIYLPIVECKTCGELAEAHSGAIIVHDFADGDDFSSEIPLETAKPSSSKKACQLFVAGTKIRGWVKRPELRDKNGESISLIVVDEASMVGSDIWNDLISYGVPVLAVGDHGQLPPISKDAINLMASPDMTLEKIHRQAAGNPILGLAHWVRRGGNPRHFKFDTNDTRVRFAKLVPEAWAGITDHFEAAIVCGKNKTRNALNDMVRKKMGRKGGPQAGDVVICLKNTKPRLFNGQRGVMLEAGDWGEQELCFQASVAFPHDGFKIKGAVAKAQFGREKTIADPSEVDAPGWEELGLLFDYGYAATCHKVQGSQFKDVIVCTYDVFGDDEQRRRWLYTSTTRASERLVLV